MSKNKQLEVMVKGLSKLPRDDMRILCRKVGARTGRNKPDTVRNLAEVLVG